MKNYFSKASFNLIMVKVDRVAALVLFVVILLYGITGYGMIERVFTS